MSAHPDKPNFFTLLMNVSIARIVQRAKERTGNLGRIKSIRLQDLLKGQPIIRMDGAYAYVDGSLPWADATALMSIAVDRAPKTVVEIGTLHGHTTRLLALNLPNAQIDTIDLPPDPTMAAGTLPKDDFHLIIGRRLGEEYRSDPSITNVTQHLGDTAMLPFPDAEFFFIDGSHTYEYVKNDTEKALAKSAVKTIVWHDCDANHPGVTKSLRELTDRGLPVKRILGTNLAVLCL
jgi:hypothetical protein